MEEHLESAKNKMIQALDVWCIHFKLIGSQGETPRYSQILNDRYDDSKYMLKSTICGIRYELNLTDDEHKAVENFNMKNDLWAWWKEIRTKHLIDNHPNINPY